MTSMMPTPAADLDEPALVARLQTGDEDAYERLVRDNGGRLLAVARRILRDEDAAADAVQEAFVNAFRAIARFDGQAQLSTWLHRIVVNTCLMRLRRRQRKPEQSLDALLPRFTDEGHHAEPVSSWAESAERRLEREETKALVWEGLAQLPEAYRALIVMRDIEGLSTHETAVRLGVSDNALKLRLHRARQALAGVLRSRLAVPVRATPRATPVATATGVVRDGQSDRGVSAAPAATRPGPSAASAIPHACP